MGEKVNLGNDNSRLVKREELLEDFGPLPPSPPPSQDSPKADLADLQQQLSVKTKECGRLKAANTELTDANATLLAENATLKADLRAALRNGSSGSINKIGSPRVERRPRASTIGAADAVLHPALEAFVPLSEAAGPASVKNQAGPEGMRALQAVRTSIYSICYIYYICFTHRHRSVRYFLLFFPKRCAQQFYVRSV